MARVASVSGGEGRPGGARALPVVGRLGECLSGGSGPGLAVGPQPGSGVQYWGVGACHYSVYASFGEGSRVSDLELLCVAASPTFVPAHRLH